MKCTLHVLLLIGCLGTVTTLSAQENRPAGNQATLRLEGRAVLVDVIVTDSKGNPVAGLKQDVFTVTEQGKPQTINFFEEHKAVADSGQTVEMPKLPENTFTNLSPFPQPAAVTVVLLDSLNTHMENQSAVHQQAVDFLETAKPGQRMAIFTMGLGLHFIQGFNDDPSVLLAALNNPKNNEVESSVMLQSPSEIAAQSTVIGMMKEPIMGSGAAGYVPSASPAMIAALQRFMNETAAAQATDRMQLTLDNLQHLAAFLEGFPGRKNIVWFAEKVPSLIIMGTGPEESRDPTTKAGQGTADSDGTIMNLNPAVEDKVKRTLAMLAAARAALYPVDPRGLAVENAYTAENNIANSVKSSVQILGPRGVDEEGRFAASRYAEGRDRNLDQTSAQILAEQSGGKAFANTNALGRIIDNIVATSGDFYTLSYKPINAQMDGTYRDIVVRVKGNYRLSYRRGYYALNEVLPGAALTARVQQIHELEAKNPGKVDPLVLFMDLGMPQTQQIVYKEKIQILPSKDESADGDKQHYGIDFAVNATDLKWTHEADDVRKDNINLAMVVYDRYGNVVTRKDHVVALSMKPDVWTVVQQVGVQLHGDLEIPKGNYWLRTGIFDQNSHNVGTMEVALSAVKSPEPEPDADADSEEESQ